MNDSEPTVEPAGGPRARRLLPNGKRTWIVAAAVMAAVIGLTAACGTAASATAPPPSATSAPAAAAPGAAGAPARSAPAEGGASGAVDSLSTSGFTMTTAAGQQVTVNQSSSTTYLNGTSPTTASAITTGANVLVFGTVSSTTIAATQVTVQPTDDGGSAASLAAGVVPFVQGSPSATKQVGQIPEDYTEGAGTIVSGTEADQVTAAALAAYPGGVVDRVALLGSGDYNVHFIGVNWPHHVFVDQSFTVVGAE
jgi:hypothetical protein